MDGFDVIARLPLTVLPDVGVKVTLKLTLWPTLKVVGKVKPLAVKPEPVALAAEIVTLDPPELVRVSVIVWELPTWTLPKPRLEGAGESWPEVVPVPDSGKVTVSGARALRLRYGVVNEIETLPLSVAEDGGANVTWPVTLCPIARVTG